jgi:hypothetical protein
VDTEMGKGAQGRNLEHGGCTLAALSQKPLHSSYIVLSGSFMQSR